MKNQSTYHSPAIGSSALLVIFGVLCLTVLAMLSLRTALTEKQMAQGSAQSVSAWYQADLEAQEIYARVQNGETVPEVVFAEDTYRYCVGISQTQTLEVSVKNEGGHWVVLRWQAVAHPEEPNDTLPVWQGTA